MDKLITPQEFTTFRNVGNKFDPKKIGEAIEQAQSDLREIMGNPFFFDVMKNHTSPEYTDLMAGSEYTEGTYLMMHNGIKSLLADLTYARYIYEINTTLTPFGAVTKTHGDSAPVSHSMIKDLVKQTRIDSDKNWQLIEGYLEVNKDTFPVWASQNSCNTSNNNGSFQQTRFTFLSTGK